MTETPDDEPLDIPDSYHHYDKDTGSLTALSTEERIERWRAAQRKAKEKGTTAWEEFNAEFLERSRAAKGPNPTQEKARKLYEWWASEAGTVTQPHWTPYQDLPDQEKKRWAVMSKTTNLPSGSGVIVAKPPRDVEKFGQSKFSPDWADYDDMLHPNDTGHKNHRRWWQFWLPRTVEIAPSITLYSSLD